MCTLIITKVLNYSMATSFPYLLVDMYQYTQYFET